MHTLLNIQISLETSQSGAVLPENWTSKLEANKLTFCKLHCFNPGAETKQSVVISHCVEIGQDLSWQLFVHGHKVNIPTCTSLGALDTTVITVEKLNEVIGKISSLNVCAGHPEKRFLDVCKSRKDNIKNPSGGGGGGGGCLQR